MRTKTYIQGFKNSQKIRVMIDGFGIYTTVAGVPEVFATHSHRQAANDGLLRLAYMRYMACASRSPRCAIPSSAARRGGRGCGAVRSLRRPPRAARLLRRCDTPRATACCPHR